VWNRRSFPVWFFALLIIAIMAHSIALGAVWLIVMAGYAVSVLIHPRARCTHCGGTGELKGSVMTWTFRRCPKCQGGRIIRRGAGVIGLPHVRQQARQQQQARKDTSTRQRW
jgi:hypothetical protein